MAENIINIPFIKMHGIGNDYVYINCFDYDISQIEDISDLAQKISDRHFGIGGDGMVLIMPSEIEDVRMRMFNSDGTEAEMCGNAVRCVGGYCYDNKLVNKKEFTVETLAGQIGIEILKDGKIQVDMGKPITKPSDIPVNLDGEMILDHTIKTDLFEGNFTAVSMGNPHAVYFMDEIKDLDLEKIGPGLENHEYFPKRINSEFIKVISPTEVEFRVWERGAGETLACGTGAAAALIAGNLTKRMANEVTFHLLGGDLTMKTNRTHDRVWKIGPYEIVGNGTFYYRK